MKIYLRRVNRHQLVLENASGLTCTQCELVSLNTGRLAAKAEELQRHTPNFAILTPRFARKFFKN